MADSRVAAVRLRVRPAGLRSQAAGCVAQSAPLPMSARLPSDDELRASIYVELRRLAGRQMRGQRRDHVLQPTALVHEAYLKLLRSDDDPERSRTHFLALASKVMRQLLVDHERLRTAEKRGGGREHVTLSGVVTDGGGDEVLVSALHAALEELAELSPESCRLVEMRFLAGMTESEVARELSVSRATVTRQWRFARAWLARRLGGGAAP